MATSKALSIKCHWWRRKFIKILRSCMSDISDNLSKFVLFKTVWRRVKWLVGILTMMPPFSRNFLSLLIVFFMTNFSEIYLSGRQHRVKLGFGCGNWLEMLNMVLQGSILGPPSLTLLFIYFMFIWNNKNYIIMQ